eukprot:403341598
MIINILNLGQAESDVFTYADFYIQKTVSYNLKQLYPRATIIGEEDDNDQNYEFVKPYIEPDQIDRQHISQKMLLENYKIHSIAYRDYLREQEQLFGQAATDADWNFYEFPDEFYEEDMVIWIDPLDGTKGFTEGHLHHITSMIGVTVKQRPRIGIIHKPFYHGLYQQGRTYFGTPECGIFIKDKFQDKLKRLQRVTPLMPFPTDDAVDDDDYKMWVCGSFNPNQKVMNQIIDSLKPINVAKVAGSGNKILYILDQKADCYLNLVPGFKYWDMCASEALLTAKMGIVTDAYQRPLIYDHTKKNYTIRDGIIVAKNKKVYDVCIKRIQEGLGKSISELHEEIAKDITMNKQKSAAALLGQEETSRVITIDKNVFSQEIDRLSGNSGNKSLQGVRSRNVIDEI